MVSALAGTHIVSTLLHFGAVSLLFIEINSLDSGLLEANCERERESGSFYGDMFKRRSLRVFWSCLACFPAMREAKRVDVSSASQERPQAWPGKERAPHSFTCHTH